MYSDAGAATCAGYPGSRGFEEIDAKDFTSWSIDYLKCVPEHMWQVGQPPHQTSDTAKAELVVVFLLVSLACGPTIAASAPAMNATSGLKAAE